MSNVADRLSKFLENAFSRAFNKENNESSENTESYDDSHFLYKNIQEYKDAGLHFRRTKDQMLRGLTRDEAFEEFKNDKKKS
tara:strand:+ start:6237 stop:6482 length:246 start_codon:yes stop_codon:yes gene_type:complete